jgi:hypothetical protein
MAFLHRALGLAAVIGGFAASASEAAAAPPSRTERIAIRRLERIEMLERKAEAAAEMPPRPADVRRMLRRGVPLSEIMPPPRQPSASAARTSAATPPRSLAPPAAPTTAATPPAAEPALRFPEQPAVAQESMPAGSASGVTPATAIDDGTRSVLVREEPTPAQPAELLPTPQAK